MNQAEKDAYVLIRRRSTKLMLRHMGFKGYVRSRNKTDKWRVVDRAGRNVLAGTTGLVLNWMQQQLTRSMKEGTMTVETQNGAVELRIKEEPIDISYLKLLDM